MLLRISLSTGLLSLTLTSYSSQISSRGLYENREFIRLLSCELRRENQGTEALSLPRQGVIRKACRDWWYFYKRQTTSSTLFECLRAVEPHGLILQVPLEESTRQCLTEFLQGGGIHEGLGLFLASSLLWVEVWLERATTAKRPKRVKQLTLPPLDMARICGPINGGQTCPA